MESFDYQKFFEDESDIVGDGGIVEYDITTSPRDLTPANIVEMIDSGIIEIPFFQRSYVWDRKTASKLIESLILGLPVPELFFYTEGDDNNTYKIIDGQQRFLSVYFFVKGRFPQKNEARVLIKDEIISGNNMNEILNNNEIFEDFTLQLDDNTKQTSRYNDLTFNALDKETQIKFRLRRFLRTVVVRQNKPEDNGSSMFEIFNRLNTGGMSLTDQEIRASLYYCDFYKMIDRLNNKDEWRKIIGQPTNELHSKDMEVILRAIALLHDLDRYTPKMKYFLNAFSQKAKGFSDAHIQYLEILFMSFVNACSNLDERAFFRNGRFSTSLFDAVFVAACDTAFKTNKVLTGKIQKESFSQLKEDDDFIALLQSGTSSKEKTVKRIKIAKNVIKVSEEIE